MVTIVIMVVVMLSVCVSLCVCLCVCASLCAGGVVVYPFWPAAGDEKYVLIKILNFEVIKKPRPSN